MHLLAGWIWVAFSAVVQVDAMSTRSSSILTRLQELDGSKHASSYVGFMINSHCVGQVHREMLPLLLSHQEKLFDLQKTNDDARSRERLHLLPTPTDDDHQGLTAALDKATQLLIDNKIISRRHTDEYPVSTVEGTGKPTRLCHINRNASPYFGITSVGVHLLCWKKNPTLGLWMAQRSSTKSHFPLLWDPTVAGGQPANLSLFDNMVKESHEEAGIHRDMLSKEDCHSVSCLSQMTSKPNGTCMKQSLYYCWELQVDANFVPVANDNEVSKFELWDSQTLLEEVKFGNRLRPAMRLVVTDFLIRHGIITPDNEPDYAKIQTALHRDRLIL